MTEHEFLSVEQALSLVLDGIQTLPPVTVPLLEALGRVLAEPVVAEDSLPPFANSSMDGFAVRSSDVRGASELEPVELRVIADVAAGVVPDTAISKGTAARIMTGAPLPQGADAVVPVEATDEPWRDPNRPLPEHVRINQSVERGGFIRWPGEDIAAGDLVIAAGHVLRPQEIGVLASLGVAGLRVVQKPRIAVLATGDELLEISEPLTPGKIRNSNGYAQTAQVLALGAEPLNLGIAGDTEAQVREKLGKGLANGAHLFISSAGVSVGAYDVVKSVLARDGGVEFWRVRMRPGKPLAYGTYQGVPFLGLPGNPVSAMVSFERFARPAILKMAGHRALRRPEITVTVEESIGSDGRESYVRAVVEAGETGYVARTTGTQGSHIMTSLVRANALLIVPEGVKSVSAGEELQALMLDWPESVF